MNEGRGASNAKAKRELDLKLIYPTWREAFVPDWHLHRGECRLPQSVALESRVGRAHDW